MKVSSSSVVTSTAKVDSEIHHASMLALPCESNSPRLGVPGGTPSLGELLSQGKGSIDAWWISLSTFAVLVTTLLLLTFMGDALRDALDPRKADR